MENNKEKKIILQVINNQGILIRNLMQISQNQSQNIRFFYFFPTFLITWSCIKFLFLIPEFSLFLLDFLLFDS